MESWCIIIHELVIKKITLKWFPVTFTAYVLVAVKSPINKANYPWVFNNEIKYDSPQIKYFRFLYGP